MEIKNIFINEKYNSKLDSMCYDSGIILASCDIDDFKISIEVRGEVNVDYKSKTYSCQFAKQSSSNLRMSWQ